MIAHAHLQFFVALPVGLLSANRVRLINGAQALLDHFGGDDEIAAGFVIERNVSRTPHRVETSRRANQRTGAAFVSL